MTRKPNLQIDTGNFFVKHAMFRHTTSGSIDFIQKSWKVGATGLKERSPQTAGVGHDRSADKIYPFHETTIQPSDIKILKELGTGGSSTVFLVSYKDSQFALKVINLDEEKNHFKSAQSEIESMRRLQNASGECNYIVNMRQAFIRNRRIAIILDYMNCASLDVSYRKCNSLTQRCSFSKPSKQQARGISNMEVLASVTSHVVLGLSEMYHHGICHRDIKPSNLLLHSFSSKDSIVKISDFGLAKILSKNEMCTEIIGTTKYHAPERLSYQRYDSSADVWSLGLVVCECFLGRFPFSDQMENMSEDEFRRFMCGDPLNHPTFPSHLFPPDLFKFVSSCLQKDPANRPTPDQLLTFSFLKHAKNEAYSKEVLGRWIEEKNLKLPKVSNPVQIRTSTPRGRRASMKRMEAEQFFSASPSNSSPVVSMSLGSIHSMGMGSSVLSQQFQHLSMTDSLETGDYGAHFNNFENDPCIGDDTHFNRHFTDTSHSPNHENGSLDNGNFGSTFNMEESFPKDDMEMFGFAFEGD